MWKCQNIRMIVDVLYFIVFSLGALLSMLTSDIFVQRIVNKYQPLFKMAEPPIILTTPKDELLFSKTTKKILDTNITAPVKVVNNSYLPPQFLFPEYQELDKHLTNHYGLPFTYKRIDPSEYFYIPYGYNYTYLAQPKDFCSDDTFMVVMIMSTVKKPEERKVLRETWFKDKVVHGQKLKYLFIVSSSPDPAVNEEIDKEALKYNDILHMDHLDSYNNITMSIMNTFNWLHRNCKSIKYILKGDPDSYFNTPKIVKWLLDLPPEKQHRLYHGSCFITSFFIRKPGDKWHTPMIIDKNDLTWPYCIGVGYVISSDLLAPLVLASRHYPYMLRTEDMSIGLANLMLNVTPYRYHDYYWTPPESYFYNAIPKCHWKNYFGFHKVPLKDVAKIMNVFEDPNLSC